MSPSSAAWSFVCREQFLLPHRTFLLLGMSFLGIQTLSRGRQCRYNSNEVTGLNWLLILWVYTLQGCLHSEGILFLNCHPSQSRASHTSLYVLCQQLPLSAKCKLSEEILDLFDKPSSQKTVLTNRSCVSIPEHGQGEQPALPGSAVCPLEILALG